MRIRRKKRMAEYLCEEDMNTGEYISRDLALKQLNATCLATDCDNYNGVRCRACAYADAMDFIDAIPAADVQPVKRGFWKALMMSEETGWDLSLTGGHDTVCEYVCSVCGKPNIVDEFGDSYLPNFCPNCGARMEEG
jgi:DNA-directed RNA polymerase subunit RPC12/RpoP